MFTILAISILFHCGQHYARVTSAANLGSEGSQTVSDWRAECGTYQTSNAFLIYSVYRNTAPETEEEIFGAVQDILSGMLGQGISVHHSALIMVSSAVLMPTAGLKGYCVTFSAMLYYDPDCAP